MDIIIIIIIIISGRSLCWDVTVICPLAESYVTGSAREGGAAAQSAASIIRRKSMLTLAVSTSSLQSRLKPWDL